jgi:hypothetical protein
MDAIALFDVSEADELDFLVVFLHVLPVEAKEV